MDYEKKYKEAQKWIESIYSELSHEQQMEAEAFFPELKESEDEKMMHQLHSWMKEFGGAEEYTEKVYTWLKSLLEKQGEQKETICDKCKKDQSFHSCQDITALGRCYIEGMNSSNNLESKFKVGDWVVYECGEDSATLQIKNIVYRTYEFTDNSTLNVFDEDTLRLWTIQDAKDGDVLVCPLPKGCESGEQIFIFKGINSRDYVENCIEYYCRVCEGEFYENKTGYMGTTSSPICPATKEQRDLLFQKIKDAGYKWDEGKKELMKISKSIWRNKL